MDKLLEIKEVKEMNGDNSANDHLALGWVLLGVTTERDGDHSWFSYSLSWPKELPAAHPPLYGAI